jgi:hypothetical protein
VRGCDAAGPEPGGPPNKDIMSPNGFAFVVRGRGISKYSIANSLSTCHPSFSPWRKIQKLILHTARTSGWARIPPRDWYVPQRRTQASRAVLFCAPAARCTVRTASWAKFNRESSVTRISSPLAQTGRVSPVGEMYEIRPARKVREARMLPLSKYLHIISHTQQHICEGEAYGRVPRRAKIPAWDSKELLALAQSKYTWARRRALSRVPEARR